MRNTRHLPAKVLFVVTFKHLNKLGQSVPSPAGVQQSELRGITELEKGMSTSRGEQKSGCSMYKDTS